MTELKTVVYAKLENGTIYIVIAHGCVQREPLLLHRGCKLGRPNTKFRGNGIVGNHDVREYSLADGKWHDSVPVVLTETEQNLLVMSTQGYTTEEIAACLLRSR